MPVLVRPQFIQTESSPLEVSRETATVMRERHLYFVLTLIAAISVLAVCGATTFFFLAMHF